MHVNRCELIVIIGLVIVNSFCGVHTAGIGGDITEIIGSNDTALYQRYRVQNMKNLGDAACFIIIAYGTEIQVCCLDKA